MKKFLVALILTLLLHRSAAATPNIVFLFADDQRADTIAAYGNSYIRTPNLDALVARGFSFRRNYCFGSNSGAVCVPSRAMLMTGKSWMQTNNRMDGEKILPELLRENGYATFVTGKWHNGSPSILRGFERGKAVFLGGMSDHTQVPIQDIVEPGTFGNKRVGTGFSSQLFADAAIEFLEDYDDKRPFFLYAAFTAPHDPRQPPVEYRWPYYENLPPLPENFLPQLPFDNGAGTQRDENLGAWPRTEEMVRDQLAEYYGLITHLDEQVGRIVRALESSRFAANTVIVYAADHGLAIGSHGLLGKQSVFEHSTRCPLIVAGPGIPSGRATSAFTYLFDLYPTLCGLAGVDIPQGLDGRDLRPVLDGSVERVRDSVFLPFKDTQRAVRDERWKLIVYPQIDHQQLFDLRTDPHEMVNLAGDPARAAELIRMRKLLETWRDRQGDTAPLSTESPQPKEIDLTGHERTPDLFQPEWIREKYFRGRRTSARNLERQGKK